MWGGGMRGRERVSEAAPKRDEWEAQLTESVFAEEYDAVQ
jgi:hypothetical protein